MHRVSAPLCAASLTPDASPAVQPTSETPRTPTPPNVRHRRLGTLTPPCGTLRQQADTRKRNRAAGRPRRALCSACPSRYSLGAPRVLDDPVVNSVCRGAVPHRKHGVIHLQQQIPNTRGNEGGCRACLRTVLNKTKNNICQDLNTPVREPARIVAVQKTGISILPSPALKIKSRSSVLLSSVHANHFVSEHRGRESAVVSNARVYHHKNHDVERRKVILSIPVATWYAYPQPAHPNI